MTYLGTILIIYCGFFLIETIVEWLNSRSFSPAVPPEFKGLYNAERYRISQEYGTTCARFFVIKQTVITAITVVFIVAGGFNVLDTWVRYVSEQPIYAGTLFIGALLSGSGLLSLPFSYYQTFFIEEKYGFNTTTRRLFFTDLLKSVGLLIVIGVPVLAAILWFFLVFNTTAWMLVWLFLMTVQCCLLYLAPTLIMPLFNRFSELEEGELKARLTEYAAQESFELAGIYTMDGSKRSKKSNAFFTGFGSKKRIVLYDTLVNNQTVDELVAVVAHEMGHYKKKHIHKSLLINMGATGLMLYGLSLFLYHEALTAAFGVATVSVYTSLVFFMFLYRPLSELFAVLINYFSRKHEYEADAYAAATTHQPEALINALKKLSVDHLSNVTPHPLKVCLQYSHPPVLDRIQALRHIKK